MSDPSKLLFFFLLTHPGLTMLGAMRTTIPGLAAEMGWPLEAFRKAFLEALSKGLVKHDERSCFLWLPNFLRHNAPESPNVVKSWSAAFDLLPECGMRIELLRTLQAYIEGFGEGFRKAFGETFGKSIANQEQEQEQDKEEEKTLQLAGTGFDDFFCARANAEPTKEEAQEAQEGEEGEEGEANGERDGKEEGEGRRGGLIYPTVAAEPAARETRERRTFADDGPEVRLSRLLLDEIRKRDPALRQPNIQTWARDMDLLLRLDKREQAEVEAVIRWCQQDLFWQVNILSPRKLRAQFSALLQQMRQKGGRGGGRTEPDYGGREYAGTDPTKSRWA